MDLNTFDLLMIIALGSLAGTSIGLTIGYAAKRQKPHWSMMTQREKLINMALVLFFSAVCIAGLAGYEMM
ncbi:MAG: hypothetical protein LUQ71_00695 [Methanoregula sp.]|nr:hypothetical protein [Methanoregula sp.]